MTLRHLWLPLALFGAVPCFAAEGRIPIPFTAGPPPYVIAAPGRYVLTRNLSIAVDDNIIRVTANDVDLDLNGMVLTSDSVTHSIIYANLVEGLAIRNGTLRGGKNGIEVSTAVRVTIERIHSQEAAEDGIHLTDADDFLIDHNTILLAPSYGIEVEGSGGSGAPLNGHVEFNQVQQSRGGIALLHLQGAEIAHNRIHGTAPSAIPSDALIMEQLAGCLVSGNIVEGAGRDGVVLSSFLPNQSGGGNTVRDNVIFGSAGRGLNAFVTSDNLFLNNTVTGSSSVGFYLDGNNNYIVGNVLNRNGAGGLRLLGSGNVYRGNAARGNTPPAGGCTGAVSTGDFCDEGTGSTSAGDNFMPGPL
jgi:parallel beta-helix repeat protein